MIQSKEPGTSSHVGTETLAFGTSSAAFPDHKPGHKLVPIWKSSAAGMASLTMPAHQSASPNFKALSVY